MSETQALFDVLRQSADPAAAAIENLVKTGEDRELNRVNVFDFARKTGIDEEKVIAAFLHASRLGIFELTWNVLCPGCGGVLDANATLKTVHQDTYSCSGAKNRRPRSEFVAGLRIRAAGILEHRGRLA
jgi:hypothetical protein